VGGSGVASELARDPEWEGSTLQTLAAGYSLIKLSRAELKP